MTLNITEGTVPEVTSTRTREPNPFDGLFPTKEGKSLVVTLPSATDEERKYVNKIASQAQSAARDAKDEAHPHGYTARVKRDAVTVGTGKSAKESTTLTIWTVDRIFRPGAGRKAAEEK